MRNLGILYLALCLLPVPAAATQERHRYLQSTGSVSIQFDWSAEHQADGLRIIASEPEKQFLTLCDASGVTSHWQINDAQHDIRAERKGDQLILRGTRNEETYSEEHTLDAAPWFQAMSYSLRAWLDSEAKYIAFWTLRPDTLEPIKLRAQRLGLEAVESRAGRGEAIHVQVRAVGLLAAFWKADYWFRATDHVLLRYQAVNGLPGTPETIIELLPATNALATPSIPGDDF